MSPATKAITLPIEALELSPYGLRIFAFLKAHMDENRRISFTYRELTKRIGYFNPTIGKYLWELKDLGFVSWEPIRHKGPTVYTILK